MNKKVHRMPLRERAVEANKRYEPKKMKIDCFQKSWTGNFTP